MVQGSAEGGTGFVQTEKASSGNGGVWAVAQQMQGSARSRGGDADAEETRAGGESGRFEGPPEREEVETETRNATSRVDSANRYVRWTGRKGGGKWELVETAEGLTVAALRGGIWLVLARRDGCGALRRCAEEWVLLRW